MKNRDDDEPEVTRGKDGKVTSLVVRQGQEIVRIAVDPNTKDDVEWQNQLKQIEIEKRRRTRDDNPKKAEAIRLYMRGERELALAIWQSITGDTPGLLESVEGQRALNPAILNIRQTEKNMRLFDKMEVDKQLESAIEPKQLLLTGLQKRVLEVAVEDDDDGSDV